MLTKGSPGFSLLELMFAMSITMGVGLVVFNLFVQNEQVFREQNLTLELQQSARAIASMMTDEIRLAGQGVPAYAASVDTAVSEASQTFISGTNASTIVFRSGFQNATAVVTDNPPTTFTVGNHAHIEVVDVTAINSIVGANSNRFLYLWGATLTGWTWVRAEITAIDTSDDEFEVTPRQIGGQGGTFQVKPTLSLEQAVAYRLSSGNIQRGISGDFATLTAPDLTWETLGTNFTGLAFTYYDESGSTVAVNTLADRASIRRVDVTLAAQTASVLPTTGQVGTFAITLTVYPRNECPRGGV